MLIKYGDGLQTSSRFFGIVRRQSLEGRLDFATSDRLPEPPRYFTTGAPRRLGASQYSGKLG